MQLTRRSFLVAGGATGLIVVTGGAARAGSATLPSDPFQLGVASGDPDSTSVVLWTRLAPEPLEIGAGMPPAAFPVQWEVATDDRFSDVIRSGTAMALPEAGHSVHVEVGGLSPRTLYWYRFRVGGFESRVGRTCTFPAPADDVTWMSFGVVGCQNWEQGFYSAYANMAKDDLDFVLHTGDYIYESTERADGDPGNDLVRLHVGDEPTDAPGYRRRYAQYKTDPHLQDCHARFPFIVTWDDHEVENNYADDVPENSDTGSPEFLARRAEAYQVYWENMPLRASARPTGPAMPLYRGMPFGTLADISVLDTRQFRTNQPCDGQQISDVGACEEQFDPSRVLLGGTQEAWLHGRLRSSSATWNVLSQQVVMAGFDFNPVPGHDQPIVNAVYGLDGWDSAFHERQRLFDVMGEDDVRNPVVLTGDIHSAWCNDLLAVPYSDSPAVGTEFVGTSISSVGIPTAVTAQALADNPHVKFYEGEFRGYLRCTVTPKVWVTELRTVPTARTDVEPAVTLATFVIEEGRAGAEIDLSGSAVPPRTEGHGAPTDPSSPTTSAPATGPDAGADGSGGRLPATGAAIPLAAAAAAIVVGGAVRHIAHPPSTD